MKKIQFRTSTWEKGTEFMKTISNEFDLQIEERDADMVVNNQDFEIRYHPDDRNFSFITCKVYNESFFQKFEDYALKYRIE